MAAEKPPFTCKFCGSASWVDPSDQSMPLAHCHPEDHGEPDRATIDLTPGRWAVCRGSIPLFPEILKIGSVTEKQIRTDDRRPRVRGKSEVLATFATYPEAQKLVDAIAGIRGERDRRINAAAEWAERAVQEIL